MGNSYMKKAEREEIIISSISKIFKKIARSKNTLHKLGVYLELGHTTAIEQP